MFKRLKRKILNSQLLDKPDALQAKQAQFECDKKISKKLSDPSTSPRCCRMLLKALLNGKKIPRISPLFHVNKFISNFKEKNEIFNSFFIKQCSLVDNGSTLPSLFPLITDKSMSDVDLSIEDTKIIISKLDSNKAHGDDMISICMLKLCDKSFCKPPRIIFKCCQTKGIFPPEWEKANTVPIHNKNVKQCVKNYRPVSLLPICSKVLKHHLQHVFTYFIEINIISKNQLGFKDTPKVFDDFKNKQQRFIK